jgi:hypothetical protein
MKMIKTYLLSTLAGIFVATVVVFSGQAQEGGDPAPTPSPDIFRFPVAPPYEVSLPIVLDLMQMDDDCLLPCFWGFHLAENSTEETTDFVIDKFQQIPSISYGSERRIIFAESELPNIRGIDFYETFLPLSGGQLQVIFGSIDDVLLRIDIRLYRAVNWLEENPFLLSELLTTYGKPTYIYFRYSGAPDIGYVLAVVYEEQGFIVEYGFGNDLSSNERLMNERITDDGRLLICVEDPIYDSIQLTLQSEDSPSPLLEALRPALDDPTVFRPFWDIEDMTGLSVEAFTAAFANNPEACIEAYSLSELREQGYD